jgi:hypothetical protein
MKPPRWFRVPFSRDALLANLDRLRDEWETYRSNRDRDAVYGYLAAVFEMVSWWKREGRARQYAHEAMRMSGHLGLFVAPEPFAAIILCTAERGKSDEKTRSKWSRVLRYAAEYKKCDEPLDVFIKRKGGLNKSAARYARRFCRRS